MMYAREKIQDPLLMSAASEKAGGGGGGGSGRQNRGKGLNGEEGQKVPDRST